MEMIAHADADADADADSDTAGASMHWSSLLLRRTRTPVVGFGVSTDGMGENRNR